ncbi:MAG: Hsp70 family protein, partial [Planctomycetaceae bacterium]|nr:Hsp70 family protein [Planctomycetaceae bacterium]
EKIIVFDLGGGTFDVSVLEVADSGDEEQESRVFQVISTMGDTHLGGDDFDEALINHVADEFKKENAIDLREDPMALQRLQEACEKAKKELSTLPETDINLPFITVSDNVPKHLTMKITRSAFETMIDDLVERCRGPVLKALEDAGMSPSDIDEIVLVGGSTRVPKVRELVKSIFGKEPHQGVNPDEVVAVGAAIQGSVLSGDRTDVLLLDVSPLTLGIETEGGVMTALVERNTTIPVEKKNVFSTAADGQTAVTVRVFQGERKMATSNRLLGEFNLEGIPPQPRGVPQIEVKFDIDQNGIVSVSAKELKTGKEASVTIKEAGALSESDIEQMRKDAEAHADEDKKQFELVEAKNRASQQVYQLEKQMTEHADKLSEADTEPMNKAIEKVKTAAEGDDTAAIKQASDELDAAATAFSKVLYEKSEAAGEGGEAPAGADAAAAADADDDAIDADFEVKD